MVSGAGETVRTRCISGRTLAGSSKTHITGPAGHPAIRDVLMTLAGKQAASPCAASASEQPSSAASFGTLMEA